jgi:Family of unknown function (DUF5681)
LAQTVTLTENGKRKKMAKRQARAKQLVNKALSNDPKAAALVLDQIRRSEALGSPAQQAAMNMTEQKICVYRSTSGKRIPVSGGRAQN